MRNDAVSCGYLASFAPRCSFLFHAKRVTYYREKCPLIDENDERVMLRARDAGDRLLSRNRHPRQACNAGRLAIASLIADVIFIFLIPSASNGCDRCAFSASQTRRRQRAALPTDCHYHDHQRSLSSRFSSGDLSSELDDEPNADPGLATVGRQDSSQPYQAVPDRPPLQSQPGPIPPPSQPPIPGAPPQGPPQPIGGDLSLNLRPGSRTTSAPSSPAKTRESLLQRVQSLTGAARDQAS